MFLYAAQICDFHAYTIHTLLNYHNINLLLLYTTPQTENSNFTNFIFFYQFQNVTEFK